MTRNLVSAAYMVNQAKKLCQKTLRRQRPDLDGSSRPKSSLLADWRQSVNASMPTPNPGYDPARSSEKLAGYEAPTPKA